MRFAAWVTKFTASMEAISLAARNVESFFTLEQRRRNITRTSFP